MCASGLGPGPTHVNHVIDDDPKPVQPTLDHDFNHDLMDPNLGVDPNIDPKIDSNLSGDPDTRTVRLSMAVSVSMSLCEPTPDTCAGITYSISG